MKLSEEENHLISLCKARKNHSLYSG